MEQSSVSIFLKSNKSLLSFELDENHHNLIASKYVVDGKGKKSTLSKILQTSDGAYKRIIYAGKLSNGEEVLIIIKTTDGLDFYVLNNSNLTFKGRDVRFSELYYPMEDKQKTIQCGKIYGGTGNENVVGIVASSGEACEFFAFIENDFSSEDPYPLHRAPEVQFEPTLNSCSKMFVVKTPTEANGDVLIQESGNKLHCYDSRNDQKSVKFLKKWEIPLHPLLENSVKNVLLSEGKENMMQVFVQFEDISVLYFLTEIGKSGEFKVVKDSEQFYFGGEVPVVNLVGDYLTDYIIAPGPVVLNIKQLREAQDEERPKIQIGFGFESIISAYLVDEGKMIYMDRKLKGFQSLEFNSTDLHLPVEEDAGEERETDKLETNTNPSSGMVVDELDALPQSGYRIVHKSILDDFNPQILLDSVNLGSGVPSFSIPIESNLNLQLSYLGLPQDKKKSSVMENTGWSLNSISSFILCDTNNDGLQSSYRYFFVVDESVTPLEFIEATSTEVKYRAKLNKSNHGTETSFTFHKKSSTWEGSIGTYKLFFEQEPSSIKWKYSWNNMATGDLVFEKFPAEWHLTRTQDASEIVSYEYEQIMSKVKEHEGLEYTQEISPKFVRVTQNGIEKFTCEFIYVNSRNSNKDETKLLTKLVRTLKNTNNSTQTLDFNYDAIKRLVSIGERFDSTPPKPLFIFQYNNEGQLDSVRIPTLALSTKLTYQKKRISWAEGVDLETKFLEFDYPQANQMVPLHLDGLGLSLFIMEQSILLFSSADGRTGNVLSQIKRQSKIKKIHACYNENVVLILDKTESSTDIHVIEVVKKDKKPFKYLKTTNIPTTVLHLMRDCSIVFFDDARNLILWELQGVEFVEKSKIKVSAGPKQPQFFVTSKSIVSWFSGERIYWSYLDEDNGSILWVEPKSYGLSIPSQNYLGNSLANEMKLEGEQKKELEDNFNSNTLQMNGNTIIVTSCELKENRTYSGTEGTKNRIYIALNLLVLDKKTGEVGISKSYKIEKGTVDDLRSSGNYGDFEVYIHSPSVIGIGLNHTIKHSKDGWRLKENEKSAAFEVPLDHSFTLRKDQGNEPISEKAVQLCTKGSCVSLSPHLSNFYPNYLAIPKQNDGSEELEIIQFAQNGFNLTEISSRRTFSEKLQSHLSNSNFLVTRPILPNDGKSIRFRLIRPPETVSVVSSIKLEGGTGGLQRTRGYEYRSPNKVGSGGVTSFEATILIPGNDKSSFGWYEYNNTNPSFGTKLFNSNGTYVKLLRKKDKKKENERNEEYSLYDSEGRFVSETIPFAKNTSYICNFGYLGFDNERVPIQVHSFCSPWIYPETNVDTRGYSLTGQNFLRLYGKELLSKSISLEAQMNYVISAWMRMRGNNFTSGSEITASSLMKLEFLNPLLSQNLTFISEVKMKRDDWLLFQIKIDMRNELLPLISSIKTDLAEMDQFECKLVISPALCKECSTSGLDVDHVVFGSTLWKGLVHVYSSKEAQQPSQKLLGTSGLFSNYWDDGDTQLETNARGFVEKSYFRVKQSGVAVGLTGWVKVASAVEDGGSIVRFNSLIQTMTQHQFKLLPNNKMLFEGGEGLSYFEIPLTTNTNSFSVNIDYKVINRIEGGIAISAFGKTFFASNSGLTGERESLCKISNQNLMADDSIFLTVLDGGNRLIVVKGDQIICDTCSTAGKQTMRNNVNSIRISLKGTVLLYRILKVEVPKVEVSWANQLGESIQTIALIDANVVRIQQLSYDEVGRAVMQTKSTLLTIAPNEGALSYRSTFVTKFDSKSQSIEGEVIDQNPDDGGMPFYFSVFESSPTKDIMIEGRPGPNYGVRSKLASRFSRSTNQSSILTLFPPDNHIYKVERSLGGYTQLKIMDLSERLIGVAGLNENGGTSKLATYEYDEGTGKLTSVLPPTYHESLGTLRRVESWDSLKNTNANYTAESKKWGTHFKFDKEGQMIKRTSPDSGTDEFYYSNNTKIVKHSNEEGKTTNFFYFEYDSPNSDAKIIDMGRLAGNFSTEDFDISKAELLMRKVSHKLINYSDFPNTQKSKNIVDSNFHNSLTHKEAIEYDYKNRIVSHSTIKGRNNEETSGTKFTYHEDKVTSITYPLHKLKITYEYDRLGQIKRLSLSNPSSSFKKIANLPVVLAEYEYGGSGVVKIEKVFSQNKSWNKTELEYNSPGFLTAIKTPGFKQSILYKEAEGYGDTFSGRVDSVMSTTFKSHVGEEGCLNKNILMANGIRDKRVAENCLTHLIKDGYLSAMGGKVLRLFHPEHNTLKLPLSCTLGKNSEAIEKSVTSCFVKNNVYGMRYQYGTHNELLKAKFYDPNGTVDEEECGHPLTLMALTDQLKKSNVSLEKVLGVWRKLRSSGFVLLDTVKGLEIGKKGTVPFLDLSFIGSGSNSTENVQVFKYIQKLEVLLPYLVSKAVENKTPGTEIPVALSESKLAKFISLWSQPYNVDSTSISARITSALKKAGKLTKDGRSYINGTALFNPEFIRILPTNYLQLWKVLTSYLSCEIGTNSLDYESVEADLNGNVKLFRNGKSRTKLTYKKQTNMITDVEIDELKYSTGHDELGSLSSWTQLNLDGSKVPKISIIYDYLIARPILAELGGPDGLILKYAYDFKGERTLKQVWTKKGSLRYQLEYLGRDSQGRVLQEKEEFHFAPSIPPKKRTTTYFYGPRGLVAFLRDSKLFNVLTDNVGSIRQVLHNGEIQVEYHYGPYGSLHLHRLMGDPEADLNYRFSGHEWDPHLQLYNFHFRLYDPKLGRFYQTDPDDQFFSPYLYAGNSPIVWVDPDGREAIIIVLSIILGIVGAYLGGAAANNRWDFWKWDYKKPSTWIGIGVGAVTGALLPTGFGSSVAFITSLGYSVGTSVTVVVLTGGAATYLSVAAGQNSWNPKNWDLESPKLYSSAFEGFAIGTGLIGGLSAYGKAMAKFKTVWGLILFRGGSAAVGLGVGYLSGVAGNKGNYNPLEWEWLSPSTVMAVFAGLVTVPIAGAGSYKGIKSLVQNFQVLSPGVVNTVKEILKGIKNVKKIQISFLSTSKEWIAVGKIVSKTGGVSAFAYVGVAAANDDWVNINWRDASTHNALFGNIWSGFAYVDSISSEISERYEPIARKFAASVAKSELLLQAIRLYTVYSQGNKFSSSHFQPQSGGAAAGGSSTALSVRSPTILGGFDPTAFLISVGRSVNTQGGLFKVSSKISAVFSSQSAASSSGAVAMSLSSRSYEDEEDFGMRFRDNHTLGNNQDGEGSASSGASSSKQGFLIHVATKVKEASAFWISKLGLRLSSVAETKEEFVTKEVKLKEKQYKRSDRGGKKTSGEYKPHNCVPWVRRGDEEINGMTCYDSYGLLELIPKEGIISGGSRSQLSYLNLCSDTFTSCKLSKTSVGIGQASCYGQKVNMTYTIWEGQRGGNILDSFNTQALFWMWLASYFKITSTGNDEEEGQGELPEEGQDSNCCQEETASLLQVELDNFKEALSDIRATTSDSFLSDWVFYIVNDLEEKIESLTNSSSSESLQEVMNDLAVLKKEVYESLEPFH